MDDFLASGAPYTHTDLGLLQGDTVTFFVEAVGFSNAPIPIRMNAQVVSDTWTGTLTDTIHVWPIGATLDLYATLWDAGAKYEKQIDPSDAEPLTIYYDPNPATTFDLGFALNVEHDLDVLMPLLWAIIPEGGAAPVASGTVADGETVAFTLAPPPPPAPPAQPIVQRYSVLVGVDANGDSVLQEDELGLTLGSEFGLELVPSTWRLPPRQAPILNTRLITASPPETVRAFAERTINDLEARFSPYEFYQEFNIDDMISELRRVFTLSNVDFKTGEPMYWWSTVYLTDTITAGKVAHELWHAYHHKLTNLNLAADQNEAIGYLIEHMIDEWLPRLEQYENAVNNAGHLTDVTEQRVAFGMTTTLWRNLWSLAAAGEILGADVFLNNTTQLPDTNQADLMLAESAVSFNIRAAGYATAINQVLDSWLANGSLSVHYSTLPETPARSIQYLNGLTFMDHFIDVVLPPPL